MATQNAEFQKLYEYGYFLMVNQRIDAEYAHTKLVQKGATEEEATAIVEHLQKQINAVQKEMPAQIIYGVICLVLGLAVTIYSLVSDSNLKIISWGMILFGAGQIVFGFKDYNWKK